MNGGQHFEPSLKIGQGKRKGQHEVGARQPVADDAPILRHKMIFQTEGETKRPSEIPSVIGYGDNRCLARVEAILGQDPTPAQRGPKTGQN